MNTKHAPTKNSDKLLVHDFWNEAACNKVLYLQTTDKLGYMAQSAERYRLESFTLPFADLESSKGKQILGIGVGLGVDHQRFAAAGSQLYGIDFTERVVE
jgi:hypothetical protein